MEKRPELGGEVPTDFQPTDSSGLTEEEAARRREAGLGNEQEKTPEKSFPAILRDNLMTLFNLLNLVLAICLVLVGSYRNMLFLGVVISNLLIGTVQEVRAQRTIRRLRLMNAPTISLIRGGEEAVYPVEEAVQGDVAVFRAGDEISADAIVLEGRGSSMEALLTGENDPVEKKTGDWLYAGAYVTAGILRAQLVRVGKQRYAAQLSEEARRAPRPESELMKELRTMIRLVATFSFPVGLLLFLKHWLLERMALEAAVPATVAAVLGMIPEGLMLLTSIAMAAGVVKLGRRQTLVQELSGIETLARADVLCLDKTGTITTGNMTADRLEPVATDDAGLRGALSRFLGASGEQSGTLRALREAVPEGTDRAEMQWPFSSETKRSAVAFADGQALILGAPSFVLPAEMLAQVEPRMEELTAEGKRVLTLAEGTWNGDPEAFPTVRRVLGILALGDEIREGAKETLRYFREQGVDIRVISGDDPQTVSRVAALAGLEGADRWLDASACAPGTLGERCDDYQVFGRVRPEQKKELVLALQARGHSVAMTGDGVNDIPAMKAANCSMAMAGGSEAARNAAQITLLNSDFTSMPEIVLEGRRVINNMTRSASLFLTKTIFSLLLGVLMLIVPGGYPFQPIQLTLISSLMVGLPGFFLALEPSHERIQGRFLQTVLLRAVPGGVAVAFCASLAMSLTGFGWTREMCSTLATLAAGWLSFLVLAHTCRPLNRKRGLILTGTAAAFVLAVLFFRNVFFLERLTRDAWLVLGGLMAVGALIFEGTQAAVRRMRNPKIPLVRGNRI